MGLFGIGGDSSSSQTSTQQTASTSGSTSPVAATTKGNAITGTNLSLGKGASYTNADSGVIQSALNNSLDFANQLVKTLGDSFKNQNESLVKSSDSVATLASSALNANPNVASANAQIDYTSILKYGFFALIALVAIIFFFRK